MKIVKHGRMHSREYHIRCERCGCEFMAKRDEFVTTTRQLVPGLLINFELVECPECGGPCEKDARIHFTN